VRGCHKEEFKGNVIFYNFYCSVRDSVASLKMIKKKLQKKRKIVDLDVRIKIRRKTKKEYLDKKILK